MVSLPTGVQGARPRAGLAGAGAVQAGAPPGIGGAAPPGLLPFQRPADPWRLLTLTLRTSCRGGRAL